MFPWSSASLSLWEEKGDTSPRYRVLVPEATLSTELTSSRKPSLSPQPDDQRTPSFWCLWLLTAPPTCCTTLPRRPNLSGPERPLTLPVNPSFVHGQPIPLTKSIHNHVGTSECHQVGRTGIPAPSLQRKNVKRWVARRRELWRQGRGVNSLLCWFPAV